MQHMRKISVVLLALLSGCATQTTNNTRITAEYNDKTDKLIAEQPTGTIKRYSRTVDVPYVGSRVSEAAPPRNIPAVLTGKVPVGRFAFDRQLTIKEFADRVAEIARVPLVVADDVAKDKGAPDKVVVNFGADNGSITLDRVMDMVLFPANLNWVWKQDRVVISRMLSRTWEIKAQQDVALDDGSGLPAGVSGGAMASTTTAKTTAKDTSISDTWAKISADIKRLLGTTQSDFDVNKFTGTVTVRGTREQVDAVDAYVQQLNKRVGRRVAIRFDTYRVTLAESAGAGVDFQAVINGAVRVASSGATSSVPAGAASIVAKALTPAGTSTPTPSSMGNLGDGLSNMQGSTIVLDALSSVGNTVHSIERVVRTRNMSRTSINLDTSQTFVCQTTPATTSNGVTTPGSATQCLLSSGFKLGVAPALADDGSISLSYKLELSQADSPTSFSTGGTTLQNVKWQTLSEHANVFVKEGEPLVVATLKTVSADNARSIGLLSASTGVNETNQRTVIVMTAYQER